MTDRPILFSAAMVRAILDGSKTVTRRIVKPQPEHGIGRYTRDGTPGEVDWVALDEDGDPADSAIRCPYGLPGDKLWVRETWQALDPTSCHDSERRFYSFGAPAKSIPKERDHWHTVYAADPAWSTVPKENRFPWRRGIHMPRWASRITLDVVSVRPERLWDITDAEIEREGAVARVHHSDFGALPVSAFDGVAYMTRRAFWAAGWNGINGKTAPWESNPWVWRIEFKRIHTEGATK